MRMLQSILFATDFKPASEDAVRVTAQLAKAFGSRISVLHVVEPLWESSSFSVQSVIMPHYRRQLGDVLLEGVRKQFAEREAIIAESSITAGPIADSIVCKAAEINADLIVLGAGEISANQTFMVGPVAQSVMEHAPQPVLTVCPGLSETSFQTILCPVDHSTVSRRGLRNAIRLARVFGSQLVVLSVVPEVSWLSAAAETGTLTDVNAEYAQQWCEELENSLANTSFEGVPHTKNVRSGVPHEQIIAAAKEYQAGLIVMGATGRTGLVRVLLGSTTRRVLRDLPCSLLTVKDEELVEEPF